MNAVSYPIGSVVSANEKRAAMSVLSARLLEQRDRILSAVKGARDLAELEAIVSTFAGTP